MKANIFLRKFRSRRHFYSGGCSFAATFVLFTFLILPKLALADSTDGLEAVRKFFPASYAGSIFDKKFTKPIEIGSDSVVRTVVKNKKVNAEDKIEVVNQPGKNTIEDVIEFSTSDISKKKFLPPDQTPSVAVNPNAPSSVISMIESSRRGDNSTAKAYAKQFVRTLQNYFFEVRKITSLIGEALIEESAIKDEDWIGAEQAIDIELARSRLENGVAIKPTQDVALKRIIPDPKKEVEVYYFFSRSCTYCRLMTPDVERLTRILGADSRVKITGLVVGDSNERWLKEFRDYTGLTAPVYDGTDFAKHLNIGFLPVLMVVSPNDKRSYFKSGQQSFEGMYEFVRTAQGLPVEDSLKIQSIVKTPIGAADELLLTKNSKGRTGVISRHFGSNNSKRVNLPSSVKNRVQVEKF